MKFVKEHLVPLICGLVVLLAVGALWWPIGSWRDDLQAQMKDRYDQIGMVQSMKSPVTIPEGPTVDMVAENVIAAESAVQENMHKQQEEITREASTKNLEHRVIMPASPNGKEVPLLNNVPMEYYLPAIDRGRNKTPFLFKNSYVNLVKIWTDKLVQPSNQAVGLPISDSDIQAAAQAEQARMHAIPGMENAGGANDVNQQIDLARRLAQNRASEIHMYVDQGAFSRQPWAAGSLTPQAPQVFDGFVESWFQQDVVNAILAVNKSVNASNVGTSPIKRLEHIVVGSNAPAANVLVTSIAAASGTPAAAGGTIFAAPTAGATPSPTPGTDLTRSMTGRVGDATYDVVLMDIGIDIDPAYQNKFIDELYRQNNGYTVLNIRSSTVDPIDAASHGFLYGDVQCVHLEILVEGLLFRNWTVPIMPDDTKTLLGIPLTAPAPGST